MMNFHRTLLNGIKAWAENEFGGAPSWNDLTDKPFDMKKTVILPEIAVVVDPDEGGAFIAEKPGAVVEVGKTYTVNWNGEKYECVAGEVVIDDIGACTYLGNVGALGAEGFEDSGDPFVIMFLQNDVALQLGFYALVAPVDGSSEATISVEHVEVKKIDEELLPEDYINSLIDAKIAAIPSAEEASF